MTSSTRANIAGTLPRPRFGGVFWRLVKRMSPLMIRLAGRRWNPVWAVVEHVGRRSGRRYSASVAAIRTTGGFVVSLAFGAHVDWYRNLVAAGGGTIRWRDRSYAVGAPEPMETTTGRGAFHPIQRFFLWLTAVDGFVHLPDAQDAAA
jgi:deazaflavin-dependent oxidoreductase (nitroreductase family)